MKYFTLLIPAFSAVAVDRCRNQMDGTQFIDSNNPHGYIECQNGESTPVDCSNPDFWYNYTLRRCIEEKAMCNGPSNFDEKYDQHHNYANGVYFMSYMPHEGSKYNNWEALLYCSVMNSYVAMPYTDDEYQMVVKTQDEYFDIYRPGQDKSQYEMYMGIVGQNVGDNDGHLLVTQWHYFNKDRHWDNYLDFTRGKECTECDAWWGEGFPTTNEHHPAEHGNEKHTVIRIGNGMENHEYNYEADGVNCLYVCPQKPE